MSIPSALFLINDGPVPIDGNCTNGVQWIWIVFRQCAVSFKEVIAVSFGLLSTLIWVVFAVPQIVENCRKGIPDQALSPFLLASFLIGDAINLLGCVFVHQLPLQIIMAGIGVLGDLIQISQFSYYKIKRSVVLPNFATPIELPPSNDSADDDFSSSRRPSSSSILAVFCGFGLVYHIAPIYLLPGAHDLKRSPLLSRRLLNNEWRSHDGPSPEPLFPTGKLITGYVLGWVSASIYIFSRIPQIFKNWQRGLTEGLSPITFIFAIIGNVAYGLQIFLTSVERLFIIRALPWIFGSLGVVLLDLIICSQFCLYRRRLYTRLEDVEPTTSA